MDPRVFKERLLDVRTGSSSRNLPHAEEEEAVRQLLSQTPPAEIEFTR